MADAVLSYFGKVPSQTDFVRYRAMSQAMIAFDTSVQKALGVAKYQFGLDLKQAFLMHSPCYFACCPLEQSFLAGLCAPSADQIGRSYPLLTVWQKSLAPQTNHFPLPVLLDPAFFSAVAQLSTKLMLQHDFASADQFIKEYSYEQEVGLDRPYNFFLEKTTALSFFQEIWGTTGYANKCRFFYNLKQMLKSLLDGKFGQSRIGLRIAMAPGISSLLQICFWHDLVSMFAAKAAYYPALFWREGADLPHILFYFFAYPTDDLLCHALFPQLESDYICALDIEESQDLDNMESDLGSELCELLTKEDGNLKSFLQNLEEIDLS